MPEQILNILKLALLAMLYLFFARVLWAVWSEVRQPSTRAAGPAPRATVAPAVAQPSTPQTVTSQPAPERRPVTPPAGRRGKPARFSVLEPAARAGTIFPIQPVTTIGRESDNTIVLADDNYVSGHHLRVDRNEESVKVTDLGSRNGTFLNGGRLTTTRTLHTGDRLQVGKLVVEAQ